MKLDVKLLINYNLRGHLNDIKSKIELKLYIMPFFYDEYVLLSGNE